MLLKIFTKYPEQIFYIHSLHKLVSFCCMMHKVVIHFGFPILFRKPKKGTFK